MLSYIIFHLPRFTIHDSRFTIHDDISRYLNIEFTRIRDEYNCLWPADQSLASDWPGQAALQNLA
jgi:hypothetical protein